MKVFDLIKLDKDSILGMLYIDLARPAVKVVGDVLGKVLAYIARPLLVLVSSSEEAKTTTAHNLEKLGEKVLRVPENQRCDINPQIGVPVLERLTYTTSEQIADLFTTLLARASDSRTRGMVHPSFVGIIDSLSSDEALIIKYIKETDFRDIEFCSVRAIKRISGGFKTLLDHVTNIPAHVEKMLFPDNTEAYMSNLLRLGVLYEPQGTPLKDKTEYQKIKDNPKIVEQESTLDTSVYSRLEYKEGYYSITPFGKLFINTVIPDTTNQ